MATEAIESSTLFIQIEPEDAIVSQQAIQKPLMPFTRFR
jgi:hypothetical protein